MIRRRRPVLRTAARAATAGAVAGAIAGRVAPAAPPVPSTATPAVPRRGPEPDRVEQLTKLAELRDAGVLTEVEFQGEKARILRDRSP